MTDARNVMTTYEYDAHNRLIARNYLGDICQNVSFTYDAGTDSDGSPLIHVMGRLATMEDHLSATGCDNTGPGTTLKLPGLFD